jgi:hypothetical protein
MDFRFLLNPACCEICVGWNWISVFQDLQQKAADRVDQAAFCWAVVVVSGGRDRAL